MNYPLVYIIILNFNNWADTIECIESIENNTYKNYKIVIIDNHSENDSERILREKFPYHIFIQTRKNNGFSAGNNIGIKYALNEGADYICLLNNDTIVDKDFLVHLVSAALEDKSIGIIGGKIYYYHSNILWYAGGVLNWYRGGVHKNINRLDNTKYNQRRTVNFITGCMMLISKDVFKDIGLFDEEYFLYNEDTDFCKRTLKKYKLLYEPKSVIWHKIGMSSKDDSKIYIYYSTRNRLHYFFKFYHKKYSRGIFLLTFGLTRIVKCILWRFQHKQQLIHVCYRGFMDFFNQKLGKAENL
ncbi:MAG: glycosyltransferase family 2 protein [Clostridiales bacterium]|jgi:GT2 family glycosyltransferase|nr:glycosyltransferase family 2 protein [Eubacteriales bacterium]MDH7566505.1 glycosyltransferase family 2 protein [Clostridiales bacterium]